MGLKPVQHLIFLLIAIPILLLSGCQSEANPVETPTASPTITQTPTTTFTSTPAFTITPRPSSTPTITSTPLRLLSPTPTASPIPPRPAQLFAYQDRHGTPVDWSYTYVTELGYDWEEQVNHLWAFLSFQLLDRGIHQRNLYFLGEVITVYYLNVAHEFNGEPIQMQLVLGGTPGANVPIHAIPAGGTAYLQVQIQDASEAFSPQQVHEEAAQEYEPDDEIYPLLFLKELQALLPTLPDQVILLANHPIQFPRGTWPLIKLDMRRVSYLAARYQPFFTIDEFDRLDDQSDLAYALRDYLLDDQPIPGGIYAFSSQTLVIITGGE